MAFFNNKQLNGVAARQNWVYEILPEGADESRQEGADERQSEETSENKLDQFDESLLDGAPERQLDEPVESRQNGPSEGQTDLPESDAVREAAVNAAEESAEALDGEPDNEKRLRMDVRARKSRGRRIKFVYFILFLCLSALSVRLYFIQITDREKYVEAAGRQHRITLEGVDNRGTIYDRNGVALTDSTDDYVYILRKSIIDDEALDLLSEIDARKISSFNRRYSVYTTDYYDKEATVELRDRYKAFAMRTSRRYSDGQPAVHLVGYVNSIDGDGVCGIEKEMNELLSKKDKVLYSVGDGGGYIIPGMGIQSTRDSGEAGVITTLDLNLQSKVEQVLAERQVNGAVVILDVESGDILASASWPVYDPYYVTEYLESSNEEFLNKAIQGLYPPGSIFKIIVAAAALESGLIDTGTLFNCEGFEEINGVQIGCSTGGAEGHGEISFRDAFAKSCNSTFIQVGQLIGGEAILEMSERLGLGSKVISDFSEEKRGTLPAVEDTAGAGIGNLSIGQGKLLVTPVQAAQVTRIIANGGYKTDLHLFLGTVEGEAADYAERDGAVKVLSDSVVSTLKGLMTDTVLYGTASNLNDDDRTRTAAEVEGQIFDEPEPSYISAAGKTGSAEAAKGGVPVVHGWFTGYLPAYEPKYAVAVLVENGASGRASAVPVFRQIARLMTD